MSGVYHAAFAGMGCAGIGPLLQAARRGLLKDLLDKKVALLDMTDKSAWGAGKLGSYCVSSNSKAADFLQLIPEVNAEKPGPGDMGLFEELRSTEIYRELKDLADRGESCSVKLAGALYNAAGVALADRVEATPGCAVFPKSRINQIRWANPTLSHLFITQDDKELSVDASNVILALGGRQEIPNYGFTCPDRSGRRLECTSPKSHSRNLNPTFFTRSHSDKIVLSDWAQTDQGVQQIRSKLQTSKPGNVTIVGGSHSAFTTAQLLLDRFGEDELAKITIVHRDPIRVFFETQDEATQVNYFDYNMVQVCRETNRVHRFAGLRSPAKDLWLKVHNSQEKRLQLVQVTGKEVSTLSGGFAQTLENANVVIPAFGYASTLPELRAQQADGSWDTVNWHKARDNMVQVNPRTGQLAAWHITGKPNPSYLANVYGIGLGYGVVGGPQFGVGEPGVRVDGMNLYHHAVGSMILDSIIPVEKVSEAVEQDAVKASPFWKAAVSKLRVKNQFAKASLATEAASAVAYSELPLIPTTTEEERAAAKMRKKYVHESNDSAVLEIEGRLRDSFAKYALGDPRTLQTEEVRDVLVNELGIAKDELDQAELQRTLYTINIDGDGSVDEEDFVAIGSRFWKRDVARVALSRVFSMYDANQDGRIDYGELLEGSRTLGVHLLPAEMEAMFEIADVNKDGVISYDEFVAIVSRV